MRLLILFIVVNLSLAVPASFGLEYPFISVDIFSRDITAGTTIYDPSSDTYTVTADGHDIWDTGDDFRFVYVEMSGDFSVSVRVDKPADRWPHSWTKAGIMLREDLSPGSKDIYLVATRDNGVAFQWRDWTDFAASWTGSSEPPGALTYPIWLRIVRSGDVFTGWYSYNGKSWINPTQNRHTTRMSDAVLVGICLTSHVGGVLARAAFGDFHIPELEASTVAIAPPDQTCREGDTVVLDGTKSWNATSFRWEQVLLGEEPPVVLKHPEEAVAKFIAPQLDVGSILTFQLTAFSPIGRHSALTHVAVKANNAPMISPSNLRGEIGNLSVTLRWEPILDADSYVLKRAEQFPGEKRSPFRAIKPSVNGTTVRDEYLEEGVTYFYAVAGKNSFPPYEGPASEEICVTAMRNLALRPDTGPIALVTEPEGGGLKNLNAVMNTITQESYDTYDDYRTLEEDWFGYSWEEPLYFDHIVYYEGQHFHDGGWWTSLTVQFSDPVFGGAWKEAANVQITPSYDFTDSPQGRRSYSRFDITFKPMRAGSIRIHGTPGGMAGFTSVAELEVYGNQSRGPLTVYGVDQAVAERQTAILDASYSFSTRGPIRYHVWEQTAGPPVTISDPGAPVASFQAPGVEEDTLLTFTITAGDGADEKTDEVLVLVRNLITRAEAGPDVTAPEDSVVELDGAASATTSGDITYEWTQLSGLAVALSGGHPDSPLVSFTAPSIWDFSEELVFQLRVNDQLGRPDSVSTDTVVVKIKNMLNTMTHVEKSGLLVIEAENYSSIDRNHDDRGWWQVFGPARRTSGTLGGGGEPTYVAVPDTLGAGDTRSWEDGAEIGYDIRIRRAGDYYLKLRRFVPHGAGHEGEKNNSCRVGINGAELIHTFDNAGYYNRWLWTPSRHLRSLKAGKYSLDIRCGEDGYRIDRIVIYQLSAPAVPEDWSSETGPLESYPESETVCSRELGTHYTAGTTHPVSLRIDVNSHPAPETLSVTEYFPAEFPVLDAAGGDASVQGRLVWTFSGAEVRNRTLTYLLSVPGDIASKTTGPAVFNGYLSYGDTANEPIGGQSVLYPAPSPPGSVHVEMLLAATVSWLPGPDENVVAYHVYRSVDGRNWMVLSGPCRQSPFVDSTVEPGVAYIYKVTSENPAGGQTDLSLCQATAPRTAPDMEVREAEDYDYGGGKFPGGPGAPPAVPASHRDDVAPGRDYFYQGNSTANSYRPKDPVDIQAGEGASGWFMSQSTPGDWWKYTFQVPVAGYVKLAYRGSISSGETGAIEFFWDENPIGKITYDAAGESREWRYYSLEPFFSGPGSHVLRMRLASGSADYDRIALGYGWALGGRKVIYGENFSNYSETSQVQSTGGWTIVSSSGSPGAWQLWNTLGDPLTTQPGEPGPALPGMTGNYMVSNGDFAPDIPLDEQLISPEIDCSGFKQVTVEFVSHINIYGEDQDGDFQTTDFDLSIYDPESRLWRDWLTIFTHDYSGGDQASAMPLSFDISSLADGKRISLRWHFYNTCYDFWWAIDNVIVSGRPAAKPAIVAVRVDAGNTLTLSWESFGTGYYTVQYTEDMSNPAWRDAEGEAWPIIGTTWTGQLPAEPSRCSARFYRVVSE